MQLIGMSGYATAGKDEAAKALVEDGWIRLAFADKLRDCLYALNPIVGLEMKQLKYLQDVIDREGWHGYKKGKFNDPIRRLLQRFGTEVGRDLLGENIWVDSTLNNLDPDGKYVVTDMRFLNELMGVRDRGGIAVRLTRPGVGPANQHTSETTMDNVCFEAYIQNDGTTEVLHQRVRDLVKEKFNEV